MAVQSGVYRGVSAEERAAERRTRLLEATLAVWADPEVSTTMTNVCGRAGLSERYFYESFANLDAALTAVLDEVATEIETTTHQAAEDAGTEPAARAVASVSAFVQLLVDDPRKGRVAIVEAAAMPALRPRRTELMRHFAHRTAEAAGELDLAPRSGAEDELAGLLFIGGVAELVTAWLDGAVDATPDELVAIAARSFLGLYH
ncbi:TetR family transcriptional regulator [Nocardioides sp. Root1257]|uniref:TetR/AcrR family transcriptional regulator n=1 Tax=unclassified Nocardioides TaxID=2615069 RepID=UPI0006F7ABA5|nr:MULTISPECIES: TetR/AcrR family transcriptional regulator [unclassified Nocardioides]KQW47670.1 TetR family transcriptional regulator [Nocardioides sp. Root1257]KRC45825.1 TetR family transcriptional regulator [Nocardioides sp. Root224]